MKRAGSEEGGGGFERIDPVRIFQRINPDRICLACAMRVSTVREIGIRER